MRLGFTKSVADSNLYYKVVGGESLILVLYVGDLFLTGAERLVGWCKQQLASEFEMKDLGLMHHFLGLEVWQCGDEIFLNQGRYVVDILRRFGMMDCKSLATSMMLNLKKLSSVAAESDSIDPTMYQQLVDSLMYLVNTRPNKCFTATECIYLGSHIKWQSILTAKHISSLVLTK